MSVSTNIFQSQSLGKDLVLLATRNVLQHFGSLLKQITRDYEVYCQIMPMHGGPAIGTGLVHKVNFIMDIQQN